MRINLTFSSDFINAGTNQPVMITRGLIHTFQSKCGPRGEQQGEAVIFVTRCLSTIFTRSEHEIRHRVFVH